MKSNPPVGLGSIIGWITFAGFELATVGTAVSGSEAQLHGPGKWTAILGLVALGITNGGRYLQAHAMIKAGGSVSTALGDAEALLPTLEQELGSQPPQSRPQGAAVPDGAQAAAPAGV